MIALFNLDHLSHSPSAFNPEKLDWLNQHYLKTLDENNIAERVKPFLQALPGVVLGSGPPLAAVVLAQRERSKTLKDLAERSVYFYTDAVSFEAEAVTSCLAKASPALLQALLAALEAVHTWVDEAIMQAIVGVSQTFDLKLGDVAAPLRVAVTGGRVSPPLGQTLGLLGRARTLARLKAACLMR